MYLRHKLINYIKIKNNIFTFIGIFNIIVSLNAIISLIYSYYDRLEVLSYAKATSESIYATQIGIILLVIAIISRKFIKDANFYSSYFEHDLDGYITYSDLAEVTGKNKIIIKIQLKFFRLIYMKGYKIQKTQNIEQVVLNSKKYLCECKSCGATIEKKEYFIGKCSYCGGSDLFAKIIADNRFYCIETDCSTETKQPRFYTNKNIAIKKTLSIIALTLSLTIILIFFFMIINSISNYNNKEYLLKLLMSGTTYSSYELIKKEIVEQIIFCSVVILAFIPIVVSSLRKAINISIAEKYAKYFAKSKTPFIKVNKLPSRKNIKKTIKHIRKNIQNRYLLNCTFEKHDNQLKLALAKKVVKDRCPTCSAPIVGAVDENYTCKYCGNLILGVITKKN